MTANRSLATAGALTALVMATVVGVGAQVGAFGTAGGAIAAPEQAAPGAAGQPARELAVVATAEPAEPAVMDEAASAADPGWSSVPVRYEHEEDGDEDDEDRDGDQWERRHSGDAEGVTPAAPSVRSDGERERERDERRGERGERERGGERGDREHGDRERGGEHGDR